MGNSPSMKEPLITFDEIYAKNKTYSYVEEEHTLCDDTCGFIAAIIGNILCCCFNN